MSESQKGRDRLISSVAWNWTSHIVFVVAGFVLPRAIDSNLGQEVLGLWDLAWSIVGYLTLMQLGLGSSVNRFVAKARAAASSELLNAAVSSVLVVQTFLGILIFLLSLMLAYFVLPSSDKLGMEYLSDIQALVTALGASVGLRTAFGAYDGVLTGMHRWDVYNILNGGVHAVTIFAMVFLLGLGYGIRAIALAYLIGSVLLVIFRTIVAHRICLDLNVNLRSVSAATIVEMTLFSVKTFVGGLSRTILYQSCSILVGLASGPAGLAVFARPLSLVSQSGTFVGKMANPLTPIIGAAQEENRSDEISSIVFTTSRISAALALCGMVTLAWIGGDIIELWMGSDYRNDPLIAILALGHVFTIGHMPVATAMIGLNAHGVPALISIVTAIVAISTMLVLYAFGHISLLIVASILSLANVMADGVLIPQYVCRVLGKPVTSFYGSIWGQPIFVVSPMLAGWILATAYATPSTQQLYWAIYIVSALLAAVIFFRSNGLTLKTIRRDVRSG